MLLNLYLNYKIVTTLQFLFTLWLISFACLALLPLCFGLFAWLVNYTSPSLLEDNGCGNVFVDLSLFVELVETVEFLKARFLSLLIAFLKTILMICMWFYSPDARLPEV